jgi:hypothetical protein
MRLTMATILRNDSIFEGLSCHDVTRLSIRVNHLHDLLLPRIVCTLCPLAVRCGAGIADDLGSAIPSASAHASAFIVDTVP